VHHFEPDIEEESYLMNALFINGIGPTCMFARHFLVVVIMRLARVDLSNHSDAISHHSDALTCSIKKE
jgi:hypothetical protein